MELSKERKIELFIILILSIIAMTSFMNLRNLHVKFINKTGEQIDSLVIAGTLIGPLKNGSSTEYIDYKKFNFDDSSPYEQLSGLLNGKKITQLNWSWCGTGRNTKSKGSYIFDLKKQINEEGITCLYLVNHNEKMFWEEN
ncbi:hypothetical protein GON26_07855 [Flavobacterium sp. GA093]|uniref:Uncharacterized protein n=1 Tax=Flavobacterium hydrocarbonoxydans TaxID=2683249 RepID=A0A6I4NJU8_9FLAO|nr:hypothetical protein [Flavobacterium hydrocarbonoxydans]MWB94273.1 hypothetical protein [Flavobacterium hydrocarbonoxydans]